MSKKVFVIFLTLLIVSFNVHSQTKPGTNLRDLVDLEHLIYPQEGTCVQVSSYDRTGNNDDGFNGTYSYLRKENNGEYVIMESDKPGAVVQIWFTNITTAGRIKFYLDENPQPAIDMDIKEFFSGEVFPFVKPLCGDDDMSSGGFVCYVPVPYKKSCKITTTDVARFYHIDYRIFDNGNDIETFSLPFPPEKMREFNKIVDLCKESEVMLGNVKEVSGSVKAGPGEEIEIVKFEGQKIIKRIEFSFGDVEQVNLKKLVLSAWWDESTVLNIESPFIDFFGIGYGAKDFKSIPLGIDKGTFYCNFPMPFLNNACFKLENGNDMEVELNYRIFYKNTGDLEKEGFVYFHAQWYQTRTVLMEPFDILKAKGKGHYTGVNQTMQGFNNLGFLEGDERIYIEGEALPIWVGTGTEDYYNGGWYFNRGTFFLPYHGLTVKEANRGRISVYRYHNLDSVPFKHNIYVGIEHGSKNNYPGAYYACTAYWYQTLPYYKNVEFASASELTYPRSTLQRTADLIEMKDKIIDDDFEGQRITNTKWEDLTEGWEGAEEVILNARGKDDFFKFNFDVDWTDIFEIKAYYGKGPDRGIFNIYIDGDKVASGINSYDEVNSIFNESEAFKVKLKEGKHTISFRVDGKDDNSTGYNIGVDFIRINTAAEFVKEFFIIGPFPSEDGRNFDKEFAPENEIDPGKNYTGKAGKQVNWHKAQTEEDVIWFDKIFEDKEDGIAYGFVKVYSPENRDVRIFAGSDDGIKLFLNGEQIWTNNVYRGLRKDKDVVQAELKEGWNNLLVKVNQGVGGWGFCVRISNYDGRIKYKLE